MLGLVGREQPQHIMTLIYDAGYLRMQVGVNEALMKSKTSFDSTTLMSQRGPSRKGALLNKGSSRVV